MIETYPIAAPTIASQRPGDHLCFLYSADHQCNEALAVFLSAGLGMGQKVLLLLQPAAYQAVMGYLAVECGSAAEAVERGQLVLGPLPSGDPAAGGGLLTRIQVEVEKARAEGYAVLRAGVDMGGAASLEAPALRTLAAGLDAMPLSGQLALLCLYDRRRFDAQQLLAALSAHRWMAFGERILPNQFYRPAGQPLAGDALSGLLEACLDTVTQAASEFRPRAQPPAAGPPDGYYKMIFDAATDAIVIFELDGRIIEVNRTTCRYLDYPYEALIGSPAAGLETAEQAARQPARMELLLHEGQITYETTYRARDGQPIPHEVHASIIDYHGRPVVLSIAHNITRRLTAQRMQVEANRALASANLALRESEAKFRSLFENAPYGVILTAEDGRITEFSRACEALLGLEATHALDRPVFDLLAEYLVCAGSDDGGCFPTPQQAREILTTGRSEWLNNQRLYANRAAPGEVRYIRIVHYPIPVRRGFRMGTILRDVTEQHEWQLDLNRYREELELRVRQRTEELEQEIRERFQMEEILVEVNQELKNSLTEKEVMLREIHHRVKNNLSVIIALVNLQENGSESPQVSQIFKDLQARVHSMALVHEALYRTPNLAQVNFADYLQNLAAHLHQVYIYKRTDGKRINLKVEAEAAALKIDSAIPSGLIVNELVTNALKYAFPPGFQPDGDALTVTVRLTEEDDRVIIHVIDNGAGFDADLDWRSAQSLGLQMVHVLSRQLRARIELLECRSGVHWLLEFVEPK